MKVLAPVFDDSGAIVGDIPVENGEGPALEALNAARAVYKAIWISKVGSKSGKNEEEEGSVEDRADMRIQSL